MYYLRKEPYVKEYINPLTNEKDSVEYTTDRAIFKHNRFGRFYRKDFLCAEKDVHLWKVKSLRRAIKQRVNLYHYCNEWFDIYDDNGKVAVDYDSLYQPYVHDKAKTTKTLYVPLEVGGDIQDSRPSDTTEYRVLRKGSILKVYSFMDYHKIWDLPETLSSEFEDMIICVDRYGETILVFNTWEEYTLNGSPWIKGSWERY